MINQEALNKAADIFNTYPRLTIVAQQVRIALGRV